MVLSIGLHRMKAGPLLARSNESVAFEALRFYIGAACK